MQMRNFIYKLIISPNFKFLAQVVFDFLHLEKSSYEEKKKIINRNKVDVHVAEENNTQHQSVS